MYGIINELIIDVCWWQFLSQLPIFNFSECLLLSRLFSFIIFVIRMPTPDFKNQLISALSLMARILELIHPDKFCCTELCHYVFLLMSNIMIYFVLG